MIPISDRICGNNHFLTLFGDDDVIVHVHCIRTVNGDGFVGEARFPNDPRKVSDPHSSEYCATIES